MKLSAADKRQIVTALLQSEFGAPRPFPLSYAQEQLWFMDKLQPGSPVYNIPLYVPFQGNVDPGALKKALQTLTTRHDMLRVHFASGEDAPVQIVEPDAVVEMPIEDLSALPKAEQNAAMGVSLNAEVQRPFDLSGLCVRYRAYKLDVHNYLLSVTMHHIITDAWSLGVFVSELNALYKAYKSGQREIPLAPLQVEYSDYAQWQRANLRGLRLSKLLKYWTDQLAGAPHILQVPTDHPRPKDQTFNGTVAGFLFDEDLSQALVAMSRRYHVTVFMLMLACYYALLYRYTGQEDILVGAPVANRGRPELEPIIGLFVNTLILRAKPRDTMTFEDLLKHVTSMALAAFEHQALPFARLVDELNVERVPGFPPLYQVVFNFQNTSLIESAAPSSEGETIVKGIFPFVHSNTAKVDLNLTVTQNGESVSGGVEYNTDLFDRSTIDLLIAHYKTIAETVSRDPSIPLMDIPLTAGEGTPRETASAPPVKTQLIEESEFSFD